MALTYNGELCKTYYSAVVGGVTVDIKDAWGGGGSVEYPYLVAVPNPWEDYASHKNGAWTAEVTPTQLLNTLVSKGYNLRGSIADITVNSYGENSSYVNSITFTDTYGNKATIKTSDKIRTVLSAYLNSANFVVGRGGQTVTVNNFGLATPTAILPPNTEPESEQTESGGQTVENTSPVVIGSQGGRVLTISGTPTSQSSGVRVMTADGLAEFTPGESVTYTKNIGSESTVNLSTLTVITADGTQTYDMTADSDPSYNKTPSDDTTVQPPITFPDTSSDGELPSLMNILSYDIIVTPEQITLPGSSSNFVFVGRGWGHGVGMSQWGALNLGQLGYDADSILAAYFPGAVTTYFG